MMESAPIIYSGRSFSPEELALMRQAACEYASLGITEISRTICEWLDWKRPTGRLKNHECRLLLERLQHQGLLMLPDLHRSGQRGPRTVTTDTRSDSQTPIQCRVTDLEPLPDSHRKRRQHHVAAVHPALPLPRLSCSRWRSPPLLCPFRCRSDSSLS